jgi:hypothetical protein
MVKDCRKKNTATAGTKILYKNSCTKIRIIKTSMNVLHFFAFDTNTIHI